MGPLKLYMLSYHIIAFIVKQLVISNNKKQGLNIANACGFFSSFSFNFSPQTSSKRKKINKEEEKEQE